MNQQVKNTSEMENFFDNFFLWVVENAVVPFQCFVETLILEKQVGRQVVKCNTVVFFNCAKLSISPWKTR